MDGSTTSRKTRVYIGGLNSASGSDTALTVEQVLERLLQQLGDQIHISNLHKGLSYCQFDACMKNNNNDNNNSGDPYELIHTSFHNVVWCKCKLQVQHAKPHFLERLAQERQQQQQRISNHQQTATHNGDMESTANHHRTLIEDDPASAVVVADHVDRALQPPPQLPRYFKVRRPPVASTRVTAQPSTSSSSISLLKVDTKPRTVSDWESFTKLKRKLRHKQSETTAAATKPSKVTNSAISTSTKEEIVVRALHLKFVDDENSNYSTSTTGARATNGTAHHLHVHQNGEHVILTSDGESSSTNSSESDSSSTNDDCEDAVSSSASSHGSHSHTTADKAENSHNRSGGGYVWSDDEESKDDDGSEDNAAKRLDSHNDDPSTKWEKIDHEEDEAWPVSTNSSHTTSDSGESDGDEGEDIHKDAIPTRFNDCPTLQPSYTGSSGSGSGSGSDSDDAISSSDALPGNGGEDEDYALQQDVASNLKILSSLFPDVKLDPATTTTTKDLNDIKSSKSTQHETALARTGWGQSGQILRYDPSNPTSQSFVVQEDRNVIEDHVAPDLSPDTGADTSRNSDAATSNATAARNENALSDHAEGANGRSEPRGDGPIDSVHAPEASSEIQPLHTSLSSHIYQQDELEDVFRRARNDTTTLNTTTAQQSGTSQAGKETFAFGFDLPKDTNATSFAFAFLPQDAAEPTSQSFEKPDSEDATDLHTMDGSADNDHNAARPIKQRRISQPFQEEELDDWIDNFVRGKGCTEIWTNLERWRNDESLKAKWLKDRAVLTTDWKRKRKAAVARKKR